MSTLCRDWHYFSNHLSDDDGRIVLIWKDPVKVQILSQSKQMMTCEILLPNCTPFTYSAIYASTDAEERSDLWVELLNLHTSFALDSKPWMIGGDFNQIHHPYEHSAFNYLSHASQMYQLRDALLQMSVYDLRFQGPVHTWSNKREIGPVAKKLDRCLINSEVITTFPHANAMFLPPAPSDHAPCLIDLAFQLPKAGTQPFKFLNYLTKHPGFLEVVNDAWFQAGSVAGNLTALCWKLKSIKRSLQTLNRENYSNIQMRVKETYSLLHLAQEQGGLGVKDLHSWNVACILKLIWLLFFRPDSVWVCWFKEVILKGELSNYWTVRPSNTFSWMVNKLIKARELVYPLLRRRLGNGATTVFWVDNWSPFGNLSNFLNARSSRLGIPQLATVASLHCNDRWLLPPARTEDQLALQIHLTTVTLVDSDDYYEWEVEGRLRSRYNMGEIYTYLKGPQPVVPWSKVVWSSYGIPRQSFLTWLVLLDRCPTKDRLIRWGIQVNPNCLLCNASHESRNHLFFVCTYTARVWRVIAERCQLQPLLTWDATLLQLQSLGTNRDLNRLTLLAAQATIYWIWRERNSRLHQQTFKSSDTIISTIDKQIRHRLLSFRCKNPRASSAMMQLWFLRS
ncbi:unnamed protein product [Brassica rapa]|uniref:Uncharacterized protein n=1 Tax=Brassica campestris TaxID=3711 RepID=A0A3P5YY68_BRACM|nr:unnamed protein product [Brassica rapa]VDC72732.1 unnamed protein product [Brassica rapa]